MAVVTSTNFSVQSKALIFTLLTVAVLSGCQQRSNDDLPISLTLSAYGGMELDECWSLSVNSARRASLTVGFKSTDCIEFDISEQDIQEVRSLLADFHTWEPIEYFGQASPDEVVREMVISLGPHSCIFSFHSLEDVSTLDEPRFTRAVVIRHQIRKWIDEYVSNSGLMDFREYETDAVQRAREKSNDED